jgi:hypothetical protein
MMVEAGEIPAICLRFASPMMISLSLGRQVRYAIFSDRSMQRSEPTRCAKSGHCVRGKSPYSATMQMPDAQWSL